MSQMNRDDKQPAIYMTGTRTIANRRQNSMRESILPVFSPWVPSCLHYVRNQVTFAFSWSLVLHLTSHNQPCPLTNNQGIVIHLLGNVALALVVNHFSLPPLHQCHYDHCSCQAMDHYMVVSVRLDRFVGRLRAIMQNGLLS